MTLRDLLPGMTATRMLSGTIPVKIIVSEVTDTEILTVGGWKFCRSTGAEIDEDLGWGPDTYTGSFLVLPEVN